MIEVDVKIPKDLFDKLDPDKVDKVLSTATYNIGKLVRAEVMKQPGPSHSPVLWASARQRRYYFAMRRKAGLPLKYARETDPMSKKLMRGWKLRHLGKTDAEVRNETPYGRYVQAQRYQSAQHRATGWVTDAQAVKAVEDRGSIQRVVQNAARKELGL